MNRTGWAVYEVARRGLLLAMVVGALGLALRSGGEAEPQLAKLRGDAALQSQAPAPRAATLSSSAARERPAA